MKVHFEYFEKVKKFAHFLLLVLIAVIICSSLTYLIHKAKEAKDKIEPKTNDEIFLELKEIKADVKRLLKEKK